MIRTSTPRVVKMITSKYSNVSSTIVQKDLSENHGIDVSISYIQNITDRVNNLIKREEIFYKLPKLKDEVSIVSIGIDGTCSYVGEHGWREVMVGTISLYNIIGERMHTIYVAESPEYGKHKFKIKMQKEIEDIKKRVSKSVKYVGLADGAVDNWSFLDKFVNYQIIDFYHVSEYLSKASKAIYSEEKKQEEWLEYALNLLKKSDYASLVLLKDMEKVYEENRVSKVLKGDLKSSITYFTNHYHQMKYSEALELNLPIGSGITESACKVLVKQRMCISGAKWSNRGASAILNLKAINSTNGRWNQFWKKITA